MLKHFDRNLLSTKMLKHFDRKNILSDQNVKTFDRKYSKCEMLKHSTLGKFLNTKKKHNHFFNTTLSRFRL